MIVECSRCVIVCDGIPITSLEIKETNIMAAKKAAPKKKGDEPVRAGVKPQRRGEREYMAAEKAAAQKKNPNVGNQSPRVKNVKKPGEAEYMASEKKAAQKKNPNANDQVVRVGQRQQRYGRGR